MWRFQICSTLKEKSVPKQYPCCAIATNSTLFSCLPEKRTPMHRGTILQNSTPFRRKESWKRHPLKKSVLFWHPRGTVSRKIKVKNSTPFPDSCTQHPSPVGVPIKQYRLECKIMDSQIAP